MIEQKNVLGNNRTSTRSTVLRVKKKKHSSLKQIFILSRDALMERKGRSALTILMVLVGGALMVTINGMSEGSAAFANKQLVVAPIFLPNELLQVWLMSLTVTIPAGLFPAWKASRLSPLIAMRV